MPWGTRANRLLPGPGHKPCGAMEHQHHGTSQQQFRGYCVPSPGAGGHTGSLTVSLGPPGSYSRALGVVCRDHTAPSPPPAPVPGMSCGHEGAMRHHPAEGACSTQTPQNSGGTEGTIPAAREQDFTQLLLFLKKSPQKFSVLAVTC